MSIEIKTERVVKDGERYIKVLKVKALTEQELPEEYKYTFPRCCIYWSNPPKLVVSVNFDTSYTAQPSAETWFQIEEGVCYQVDEFYKRLAVIKKCGNRLHELNKAKHAKWLKNKYKTYTI